MNIFTELGVTRRFNPSNFPDIFSRYQSDKSLYTAHRHNLHFCKTPKLK